LTATPCTPKANPRSLLAREVSHDHDACFPQPFFLVLVGLSRLGAAMGRHRKRRRRRDSSSSTETHIRRLCRTEPDPSCLLQHSSLPSTRVPIADAKGPQVIYDAAKDLLGFHFHPPCRSFAWHPSERVEQAASSWGNAEVKREAEEQQAASKRIGETEHRQAVPSCGNGEVKKREAEEQQAASKRIAERERQQQAVPSEGDCVNACICSRSCSKRKRTCAKADVQLVDKLSKGKFRGRKGPLKASQEYPPAFAAAVAALASTQCAG